jgi:hypothetical protein
MPKSMDIEVWFSKEKQNLQQKFAKHFGLVITLENDAKVSQNDCISEIRISQK